MKKLLLIYSIILILQGGVSLFASVKVNFAELILKEKNESNFWIENQNLINQNAGIQNIKFADEAPFTSSWNIDVSTTTLSYCSGASKYIPLLITPKDTTFATYRIEWGDGDFTDGNYQFIKSRPHVYSTYGEYTVTMTFGNNPPFQYIAYYGLAPSVKIIGPQLNQYCVGDSIELKVFGTENNPKGTKYELIFTNKPDSIIRFGENNPLPQTLKHVFKQISSCGFIYRTGDDKSYENAFGVIIKAINPCSPPNGVPDQAGPYYVSSVPKFNNKRDTIKTCVNKTIKINNLDEAKTTPYVDPQGVSTCQSSFKKRWIITPGSGWVLNPNQTLGYTTDSISPNNPIFWEDGSTELDITFTQAGLYKVTALLANQCFTPEVPQFIKVDPIINPQINEISKTDICGNIKIALENTTQINPDDYTGTPKFYWTVSTPGKFINNTDRNSLKPEFELPQRGNYTITLTYTGTSCEDVSITRTYTVRGAPIVNINPMDACLNGSSVDIKATATINDFGETPTAYKWTIKNNTGTEIFTDTIKEPIFTFNQIGVYTAQLEIVNSCGTTTTSRSLEIAQPTISSVSNLTVCENQVIPTINFNVSNASQGISWTNSNTAIGLPSNGTSTKGNEQLPSFKALNPGVTPITATITVYPLSLGCMGNPISFTITVNPSKDTAPHNKQIICAGDNLITLKAKYNAIDNNPHANYQWYMTDGIRPQIIPGATSWEFNPDNIIWGTYLYYCRITPKCDDPQQPCCDPFNSQNDTITILPKGIIKDTLITVAKSVNPYNLTPVDGVNQNVIPDSTKYKWTILSQGYGSIIGATEHTIDSVNNILQTFNLPDNFSLPYDSIVYQVNAISGSCQTTYQLTVRVVPGITANVICNDIKCFGETGSIEIKDIFGIMDGNTIIRLLDKNNNDNILAEINTTDNHHTFTNLAEGNYKVSIFDENGVSIPYEVSCSFAEPPKLIFDNRQTKAYDVKCRGESNGEIYVKNTGGIGDYKYLWEKKDAITGNFVAYSKYTKPQELKNLTVGEYKVTVIDVNNCSVDSLFIISQPAQLYFTATGSPVLNCDDNPNQGGSIVISSPGGGILSPGSKYQFTWTKKNQSGESPKYDLTGINSILSDIQEGIYIIEMYDDNNCSVKSPEVRIDRAPALAAKVDSLLVFDCDNHRIFKQYTVTSSGGVGNHTVRWFDDVTELATGNTYVPDNSLNKKLITVKVTDSRNCVFTLTVTPFVLHLPVFDFRFTKTACNKYQFEAIAPENVLGVQHSFRWNFSGQDSGQGKVTEYDLDNLQVNASGEYFVELIVVDNFTPCNYPVVRKIFPKNFIPDLRISSTGTVETVNNKITVWYCEGDTISVFGENANAYSWSNGSNRDNIKINYEGQFTLWGKNADGCEGELNFETKYYKFGYDIVTDKDEINLGETVKFNIATFIPDTKNYLWNFGDGTMDSSPDLPYNHTYHFFAQDYFDVLLTATNPKGCKEYATKRIKVNISSFPNTIMPGSVNPENRVFMKGCQVQIYNRNGVLLHEGADGWDGTYNGKLVSSDTYFYVMTYTQATGARQTVKGYVTVIR